MELFNSHGFIFVRMTENDSEIVRSLKERFIFHSILVVSITIQTDSLVGIGFTTITAH